MKEDYFGPRGEIPKLTPEDVEEVIRGSDQFGDVIEQSKFNLSRKEIGGLSKKIEQKPVSWLDKLTARDRARVEEVVKEKLAEREEISEQVGKEYSGKFLLEFDKFLNALRVGSLDKVTDNFVSWEVVRQTLLIGDFSYARNLGEIIREVWLKEKIIENGRIYTGEEIIKIIADDRIDDLPKFQNLRLAITNLLDPSKDYSTNHSRDLEEPEDSGDEWKRGTP